MGSLLGELFFIYPTHLPSSFRAFTITILIIYKQFVIVRDLYDILNQKILKKEKNILKVIFFSKILLGNFTRSPITPYAVFTPPRAFQHT